MLKSSFLEKIFSLKNIDNHKVLSLFFIKIKFKLNKKKTCVVLVDPGGIGDYMFCRPYFKYIKQSPKYKNCDVIYIGNSIYIDMVKTYDSSLFDKIISFDSKAYREKPLYRLNLLHSINIHNVISVINCRCPLLGRTRDWEIRHDIVKT